MEVLFREWSSAMGNSGVRHSSGISSSLPGRIRIRNGAACHRIYCMDSDGIFRVRDADVVAQRAGVS